MFGFRGVSAYLETVVCRMTTPRLETPQIRLFSQLTFSVPSLAQFTEDLRFDDAVIKRCAYSKSHRPRRERRQQFLGRSIFGCLVDGLGRVRTGCSEHSPSPSASSVPAPSVLPLYPRVLTSSYPEPMIQRNVTAAPSHFMSSAWSRAPRLSVVETSGVSIAPGLSTGVGLPTIRTSLCRDLLCFSRWFCKTRDLNEDGKW